MTLEIAGTIIAVLTLIILTLAIAVRIQQVRFATLSAQHAHLREKLAEISRKLDEELIRVQRQVEDTNDA